MASGKSKYLERKLLDLVAGGVVWTSPGTVYVALSTLLFDDSLAGSALSEPAVGAYARASVANTLTQWPAAATASGVTTKSNGIVIPFPTPTAAWGEIKAAYVCDALASGNVLFGGDLAVSKVIALGDVTQFGIGTIVWEER